MAGITHPRIVEELRRAATTDVAAVADVDLDIKDNSFVTLLGPVAAAARPRRCG